ncbi:MAG: hypothetical protein MZU84_05080 [Sphingobacterium sp.]|nr:hypothetical protein [Sphingobacterium sp.]
MAHVKRLEKENRILKELLAEKELESRLKDELLKKVWSTGEKREVICRICCAVESE